MKKPGQAMRDPHGHGMAYARRAGMALRKLREDLGDTLEVLEGALGLNFSNIAKREKAKPVFKLDELYLYADALDYHLAIELRPGEGLSSFTVVEPDAAADLPPPPLDDAAEEILGRLRAVLREVQDPGTRRHLDDTIRMTYGAWRAERKAAGEEHNPLTVLVGKAG